MSQQQHGNLSGFHNKHTKQKQNLQTLYDE